ncbi:AsmA family protein [Pseudodonghicola flavimaris]|uniref:AsmA family protein n=1 Tax=Pseudodonghicola flavimaris TaxID=3050036 RepID=A0ABT7EVM8_9RHOB|nr:AsmA family protein [Pseudodonghicola flavimaris]MDK3016399.1 AsmA family protein [Pseudodonghicola flavimaris]
MTRPDPVRPDRETGEPSRRRLHHVRRAGVWTLRGTLVAVIFGGLAIYLIVGTSLHPPHWMRDRVEARIERSLNGLQISFGDIEMVIRKGWRPRLRLRDVVLSDPDGQVVAQLSNAEASLALRPLLRGQVQPKRIALSGLRGVLRRDKDGALSLMLAGESARTRTAQSLSELIAGWTGTLANPQLAALVSVDIDAVTLRYEDGRSGKVWTLDDGQLRLDRTGEELRIASSIAVLSGRDYASTMEANYTTRIGAKSADFGVSVRDVAATDIASQIVALAWLDVLQAPISGALRGSVDDTGVLGPLSATLQIGPGALQPNQATRPIRFSDARSYFTYRPDTQELIFDELSVDSAWGRSSGEGRAQLDGIDQGRLTGLVGQFTVNRMEINPAGLYPTPLRLDSALMDFRLELNPFRVTLGQMYVSDGQSGVHLSGQLEAGGSGWRLAVDGAVDKMSPERLLALWPATVAPKPRAWVEENILAGDMSDIDLALRLTEGEAPEIYGDFEFTGGKVRYNRFLPLAEDVTGQVTLERNRFVVSADSGRITPEQGGPMEIAGTSFIIPDIGVRPDTPAVLNLRSQGTITSVMSVLAGPPIRALRDTTLPVDMAQGSAAVEGRLAFPMKKDAQYEEMRFFARGLLQEVSSDVLVPGQHVSATALWLETDQDHVQLSGTAHIGDLPVVLRWQQALGPGAAKTSRVEGQVELSQKLLDTFGIGLPKGSVSGQGTGRFGLDLGGGALPHLTLRSDLRGVGLAIPPLGWSKPAAASGAFTLEGELGERPRVDRMTLQAAGLEATGSLTTRADGTLDRARFPTVTLGNWLSGAVDLVGRGKAAPDINVLSGRLDLQGAQFGSSGGATGGSSALNVALDRLQISDGLALTDFRGAFTTTGGLQGNFTGRLNGQTAVSGSLQPKGARSVITVTSEDGGGVFRSAGVLDQAHGGAFSLVLTPVGEAEGYYDGHLKVTGTRVKDAPAIAALLNAVSVVGLLDEMSGQGIQFSEVEARFRLEPDRLVVLESSAVGPSIGLSMDGYYDLKNARLNMRGVISPVYMINAIGSLLTRKGEGMIGFNYTLTGPASDPSVQVNPLSGLAPAMLRDLFRGERPTVEAAPEETPGTTGDQPDTAPVPPEPSPERFRPHGGDR